MRRAAIVFAAALAACSATRPSAGPPAPSRPESANASAAPAKPKGLAWTALARAARDAEKRRDESGVRDALMAMRAIAPNDRDVDLALAECEQTRGDADAAVRWLDAYASAGLTVDLTKGDGWLVELTRDPRAAAVRARLEANARPVSHGSIAFALPTGDLLFEDVAWDPDARVFYVASVRGRRVLAITPDGSARVLTAPEADGVGVMGLALDRARHVLWASFTSLPQVPGYREGDEAKRPGGLVAIDPARGEVKERIALPPDGARHALTDVALTRRGDVLLSDARGGVVYVLRAGAHALAPLAAGFRSPQTPAPRDDGRAYVPDYALGIAIVDTASGATSWLDAPSDVDLHGIDGLYFAGDALVALQNGTTPPRVIRFDLDPSGAHVTSSQVLEAGTAGLGEPTHGAIVQSDHEELWFLAMSGWSRFGDDGPLVEDPPPDAPAMWRVRIDRSHY